MAMFTMSGLGENNAILRLHLLDRKPCWPFRSAANHGNAEANAKAMCAKLRSAHQAVLPLPIDSAEFPLRLQRKLLARPAIELSLPQPAFDAIVARSVSQ